METNLCSQPLIKIGFKLLQMRRMKIWENNEINIYDNSYQGSEFVDATQIHDDVESISNHILTPEDIATRIQNDMQFLNQYCVNIAKNEEVGARLLANLEKKPLGIDDGQLDSTQ